MKKRFLLTTFLILLLLPLCLHLTWAAEKEAAKDFDVYDLGEVVISADKPAVKEIANTNIITAEDIAKTNSHSVAQALESAPGIRVTTGTKNQPSVSLHGLQQSEILVLIDGVPFYETYYGSLDLNQIPTDNIAKIEITEGAASVLYGPNGLGGVINIVTKKATDKPYTSLTGEVSDRNTYRLSATNGRKIGIFSYWLNYAYQTSNGWNVSDDFTPRTGTITKKPGGSTSAILQGEGLRVNSDLRNNYFWAKFGIEPNQNSEYYINFHYLNREKGNPPSLDTVTIFPNKPAFSQFWRVPKYEDWGVDLNAKQKIIEPLTLRATLFYHNHIDDLASYLDQDYQNQIALSRYRDYTTGGSLIIDYQPIKWDILRLAASYKADSHEDRDDEYLPYAKKFSYTGSVGLENEYKPMENLALVVGASYDWFDVSEAYKNVTDGSGNFLRQDAFNTPSMNSFNPMGGVTYTFADATKVYASVAKKTRFPTLFQLYTSKGGNPDLTAETGINYTLGVKRPFSNYALAEAVLFYYDLSDMIVRSGPNNTDPLLNISKVRIMGLELKGEVYPTDDVTVGADFTYNNAADKSDRKVTDDVTNVPKYKADAWIRYVVPYLNLKTRIELTGIYVGRLFSQLPTLSSPSSAVLETSDYFVFNAKVSQPFLKYFEFYVACNNLYDKNYEPESGYPAPGRTFWTGVSAKF